MNKRHHTRTFGLLAALAALSLPLMASAAVDIPTPTKTVAPKIASDLADATGDVRLLVEINKFGYVTNATVDSSTNAALDDAALKAIHQWTFEPATENGQAIASKVIQPFHFGKHSISIETKEAPEDVFTSVARTLQPELSADLQNITGEVVLEAQVDPTGRVTGVHVKSSSHAELEAPAAAALQNWKFNPRVKSGEAVASKVLVPFKFKGNPESRTQLLAQTSDKADSAPKVLRRVPPALPSETASARGQARLQLTIDEHGYVADASVIESSDANLSAAAKAAVLQWKFKPALENGKPVASKVIQPFSFNGGLITEEALADNIPTVKRSVTPELPEALRQVRGFVQIKLNLDAQGKVVAATATHSSHDELEAPTVEAAKNWTFTPAIRDGSEVPAAVVIPFLFNVES